MLTAKKIKTVIQIIISDDKKKLIICDNANDEEIILAYTSLMKAAMVPNSVVCLSVPNKEALDKIIQLIYDYIIICDIDVDDISILMGSKLRTWFISNGSKLYVAINNELYNSPTSTTDLYMKIDSKEDMDSHRLKNLTKEQNVNVFTNSITPMFTDKLLSYKKIIINN